MPAKLLRTARVLLPALLLGTAGCSGSAPPPARNQAAASTTVTAQAQASTSPKKCALVAAQQVSAVVGKPVGVESAYRSLFVLPSMPQVKAEECTFSLTGRGGVTAVNIRSTTHDVKAMFTILGKYDTPALSRLTSVPPPASAAYWQSLGSTAWVREGGRAVVVELVSDDADPSYQGLAVQLALDVLASSSNLR